MFQKNLRFLKYNRKTYKNPLSKYIHAKETKKNKRRKIG